MTRFADDRIWFGRHLGQCDHRGVREQQPQAECDTRVPGSVYVLTQVVDPVGHAQLLLGQPDLTLGRRQRRTSTTATGQQNLLWQSGLPGSDLQHG